MPLLDVLQDFQAVDLRHHDVDNENVVVVLVDLSQGIPAIRDGLHLVAFIRKDAKATSNDDFLIVNDQYPGFH